MTVSELIEELRKYPPDASVKAWVKYPAMTGDHHDIEEIVLGTDISEAGNPKDMVVIDVYI